MPQLLAIYGKARNFCSENCFVALWYRILWSIKSVMQKKLGGHVGGLVTL